MASLSQKYYDFYQRYRNDTLEWRENRDRNEHYYHGHLFTATEGQEAQANNETTVVDNRLRPLIRKRVSKIIAQKPTGKIFGVGSGDQHLVNLYSAMGDYFWEISDGMDNIRKGIEDQQKLGVGYWVVYSDDEADFGAGELKFKSVSYRDVFYDVGFESLQKAPRIIIRHLWDADEFFARYPGYKHSKSKLLYHDDTVRKHLEGQDREFADVGGLPENMTEKHYVLTLEVYERVYKDVVVYREIGPDGNLIVWDGSAALENDDLALQQFVSERLDQQALDNIRQGLAFVYTSKIPRIDTFTVVGDKYVLEKRRTLPLDKFPVIECRGEDTRNGKPTGEIDYLWGTQEFMNKCLNIIIGNAAMGSFLRYIVDPSKGFQYMTKDEFDEAITTPGGVLQLPQDYNTGKFPMDVISPEPLNEAFTFLMQHMAYSLEYSTQTFGPQMGDTQNTPRTALATLKIGEWADESLAIPRNNLEKAIMELYDVFFQWVPHYYTKYKTFITYDDDEEEEQEVEINKPVLTAENQEGFQLLNNITNFRARYRIKKGSTAPSMAVEKIEMYKDLLQVTQHPAFLMPLLDYLPVKDKKALKQSINVVPKLQKQLEQLNQQRDILKGELDRQTQQNIELRKDKEVNKAAHKVETEATKSTAEMKSKIKELDLAIDQLKQVQQQTKAVSGQKD